MIINKMRQEEIYLRSEQETVAGSKKAESSSENPLDERQINTLNEIGSSLDILQSLSKVSKTVLSTLCFMVPENELDELAPYFANEIYIMESINN